MGCNCERFVIILTILFSILCSLGIVGAIAYYHITTAIDYVIPQLVVGAYIVGAVLFIMGILGSVALTSEYCFINTIYIICLVVILGVQIYFSYITFENAKSFDGEKFWKNANDTLRETIQMRCQCCGYSNTKQAVGKSCKFSKTCKTEFADPIKQSLDILKWVMSGAAALLFVIFIFAVCVATVDYVKRKNQKPSQTLLERARLVRRV